jgi:hypothetical protein
LHRFTQPRHNDGRSIWATAKAKSPISAPPLSLPSKAYRLVKVRPHESSNYVRCEVRQSDRSRDVYYDLEENCIHGQYTALSYTWGTVEANEPIHMSMTGVHYEDEPTNFTVTQNLAEILSHIVKMSQAHPLQRRLSGWWWIDALCIVQDDSDPEKDDQIKSMPNIYAEAREVFAWIGRGNPDTHRAMRYIKRRPNALRKAAERGETYWHLKDLKRQFAKVAFCVRDIFARTYWTRLWILQKTCHVQEHDIGLRN